jgi:hypothetical protein
MQIRPASSIIVDSQNPPATQQLSFHWLIESYNARSMEVAVVQLAYSHQQARQWV